MKIKELHLFYLVLLLHVFASVFTGYFEAREINPGTIRGVVVSIFVIYFIFRRYNFDQLINSYILIYLIYVGILTLLSSNTLISFYLYTGYFISLMMLPIGYYYISSREVLFQLSKIILIILAIFSVNTIISNYLQLGVSDYLEGSLYFGGGRVNITKTMVVGLISAPIYLFWEKSYIKKYIAIVIYLITFSICLVGIKRSVLLTMILGLLIFIVFGPSLLRSAKYYIFGVLIVLLTYPLYGDVFVDRFQSRQDQFAVNDEVLESEGRYLEIESVTSAIENGSWKHKLIGSEVFNDREFFDTRRMLHTDYMILLNGTGIIGFTLWLLMYLIIIKEKKRKYRQLKKTEFIKILNAVFWMLIASQFLLSISGSVYDITLRSFLFVMIGAVLGVLNNEVGNNVH